MTIFLELRPKFVFIHRRIISIIISMLFTSVTNTAREHRCHVLTPMFTGRVYTAREHG